MKVKYQIFISSTYEDLKDIRESIIKCVLEMGHIPVGMEMFSAADEEQWKMIQKQIDECDYYVVIVAHRYGSIDKGVSYTEKEYDYASEKGIPILGFIIEESAKWPAKFIDKDSDTLSRLSLFKEKIKSKMINQWKTSEDLYAKAAIALSKAFTAYERPGYVRGDELATKGVFDELARLSTENARLRDDLSNAHKQIQRNKDNTELEFMNVLKTTNHVIPIKFKDNDDEWDRSHSASLLDIFEAIAPKLVIEADEHTIRKAIALGVSGRTDYYAEIPVPMNRFSEWMLELYTLELVEPSKRVHSVSDTKSYWSLTEKGRQVSKDLLRLKIYSGIQEENDDDDNKDNSGKKERPPKKRTKKT